jgi:predicted nucleotidyltransferase component of viral defense system
MTQKTLKNVSASIRQRLLNKAKTEERPFNELLQYYAMERFLYRLSKSDHVDKFVLKGALALRVWKSPDIRPTMDIDLLGRTSNRETDITRQIENILDVPVDSDGLAFDCGAISTEEITEDAEYSGIRVTFWTSLGSARIKIQIDIGFGDAMTPEPEFLDFPSMLDNPAPKLWCYSRETTIAEKLEAIITLGMLNSRMKDFYDIWMLSRNFDFTGETLNEAVVRTLRTRGTNIPETIEAFSVEFGQVKQKQWIAFQKRIKGINAPMEFKIVIEAVVTFLNPIIISIQKNTKPPSLWIAPGQWQ